VEVGRREVGPRELLGRGLERKGRGEGREGWGFLFFFQTFKFIFQTFEVDLFSSNFKFKFFLTFQTFKTF
jgi:hypothetical protein